MLRTSVARAQERQVAMTGAQRLKRGFNIDIEICQTCGGAMKIKADTSDRCIEDQAVMSWPLLMDVGEKGI